MGMFKAVTLVSFNLLLGIVALIVSASSAQAHSNVQLLQCFNCQASQFEGVAQNASSGVAYVYDAPNVEVKAFRVIRNTEPGNTFIEVLEIEPDYTYKNALINVMSAVSEYSGEYNSTDYDETSDMDSVFGLASRDDRQDGLIREISRQIQSTLASDVSFLLARTRYSNAVTQALGWDTSRGIRITFPDGSYIELSFSEAIVFSDGSVNLEFKVIRMVDSKDKTISVNPAAYYDRTISGEDRYLYGYQSLLSAMGFSVSMACMYGVGGRQSIHCPTNETCIVTYYQPSC